MKKISRRSAVKLFGAISALGVSQGFGKLAHGQTAPPTTTPALPPVPPAPAPIAAPDGFGVAAGPFQPTLESLSAYQVPDWYRDAKFGIWAHWGPQCQPEMGDWYAQHMYQFNNAVYKFHVHPSKFGFKDVINEWKADKWDPAALIALYKSAGAKFFAAMANHHDNLDMFDSTYQPWNSTKVGPKKDIVGGWAKAARDAGLRFAISSHGSHTWDWLQVSRDSDPSGPMAGVPYDGFSTKEDGKGKWWDGLDPQDLYAQYHPRGRWGWNLSPQGGSPAVDKAYVDKFFNRTIDLINKYSPDILYFDDSVMPIYPSTDIGPRIAAYLYNTNIARNGKLEAVMTGKDLKDANASWRKALMLDLERGVSGAVDPIPWQTDTCIGNWHYQVSLFQQHKYKTSAQVVQMLIDIVSKNGNLMLNIPVKGDGTIDSDEQTIVEGIGKWMAANGEGIFATRPWEVYGEGPSTVTPGARSRFGGSADVRPYTPQDIRYTSKGDTLFAFVMGWPEDRKVALASLATGSKKYPKQVGKIELLGSTEAVTFTRDETALNISLPPTKPNDYAYALKIVTQ
jgi:alpha-L-fucosidase